MPSTIWICLVEGLVPGDQRIRAWTPDADRAEAFRKEGLEMQEFSAVAQAASDCGDDENRMEKISAIRRGGLSWGAVALNRQDDDRKHGVFDLQCACPLCGEKTLETQSEVVWCSNLEGRSCQYGLGTGEKTTDDLRIESAASPVPSADLGGAAK